MLVFKQRLTFEIARAIKAFLNLDAGVTRGKVPDLLEVRDRELAQARRQIAGLKKRLDESGKSLSFDPTESYGSSVRGVAAARG